MRPQPSIPNPQKDAMQNNAQCAICAASRYFSIQSTFRRVLIRTKARRSHAPLTLVSLCLVPTSVFPSEAAAVLLSRSKQRPFLDRSADSLRVFQAPMAAVPRSRSPTNATTVMPARSPRPRAQRPESNHARATPPCWYNALVLATA